MPSFLLKSSILFQGAYKELLTRIREMLETKQPTYTRSCIFSTSHILYPNICIYYFEM